MDWSLDKGTWRDNSPIGKRIQDFIMKYPEWLILLRRDERFPCIEHHDFATKSRSSFSGTCDFCLGFGVKVLPQIVPCRVSRGRFAEISSKDEALVSEPGMVPNFTDVAHFPRIVLPQINDILISAEWDKKTTDLFKVPYARPVRFNSIWTIRNQEHHTQREVSWISCGLKSYEINDFQLAEIIPSHLRNLKVIDLKGSWDSETFW